MHILYIVTSLDDKAPVNIVRTLAEYELEKGNEITVGYFDNIKKIDMPCTTVQLSMSTHIDFEQYDIIHSHLFRPDKYVAKYAHYIKKAKTISTVHCYIEEDLRYSYGRGISVLFTPIWIRYLKKFNTIVEINDYMYEKYAHYFKHNVRIYNGIKLIRGELPEHRKIIDCICEFKKRQLITIVTYSELIKRKGLDQIVDLLAEDESIAYICIGKGTQQIKMRNQANRLHVEDRIAFFDFVKRPYEILKYADLYAIPSYSEGFSLAFLEAGMVKTNVVCSDIPAFSRQFSSEEVNFFSIGDIGSLRKAVYKAHNNQDNKKNNLLEKISNKYSSYLMCCQYDNLYNTLVNN